MLKAEQRFRKYFECTQEEFQKYVEPVIRDYKKGYVFAEGLIKDIEKARDRLSKLDQLSYPELYKIIKSKSEMR